MGKNKLHMRIRAILYKVYLKKSEENHPFSCTIQKLFLPLHRQNKNNGTLSKQHNIDIHKHIRQQHGTNKTQYKATPPIFTIQREAPHARTWKMNNIPNPQKGRLYFFKSLKIWKTKIFSIYLPQTKRNIY